MASSGVVRRWVRSEHGPYEFVRHTSARARRKEGKASLLGSYSSGFGQAAASAGRSGDRLTRQRGAYRVSLALHRSIDDLALRCNTPLWSEISGRSLPMFLSCAV
jgi:hypothetical protein